MEDLLIEDATINKTYCLRVDCETAQRARDDPMYATHLVTRYVQANNKESIYNDHKESSQSQFSTNDECNSAQASSESASVTGTQIFWSREETLALISAYDHFKENLNHYKKKKYIWSNIETYLAEKDIIKSEKSIETKWKNLLRTYKNVKDNNNKSGRGTIRFQFLSEMDEVLGDNPLIQNKNSVGVGITEVIKENENNYNVEASVSPSSHTETNTSESHLETPTLPMNRRKDDNTIFSLKRKYLRQKIEGVNEKKSERDEYLRLKRAKEEREERKLKLKERELDIEERKVQAFETYLLMQKEKN